MNTKKRNTIYTIIALTAIVYFFASCSTQKNTAATRGYHQMCTEYNVGFNAKNAYIEGIKNINNSLEDDYTQLLPIFPISNEKVRTVASGQMDRTIEKCRKAIKKHSITKKPKKNHKKAKDPEYQYFYNQEEYVQGVKDAWILLGNAEFNKGDFIGAASTFSYIQKHYPSDKDIVTKARIYQAQAYGEMDWIYEADEVFSKINELDINSKINKEYTLTKAYLLIKSKQYSAAIPHMQIAIKKEHKKFYSSRYNFILGQLYLLTGQKRNATQYFKAANKEARNYQMQYNAKLMLFQCDTKGWKKNIKKLEKMAKNSKNKEYLDQLYTTMGDIYLEHRDTLSAIESYKKGIELSTRGGIEKAQVLIILGDLYYDKKEFAKAHPCYEEAFTLLSTTHDDYKRVMMLSETLGEFAQHYNTVQLQDSLQHLATLTEEEQLAIVNKIIEQVKKEDEEARKKAEDEEKKGFVAPEAINMNIAQATGEPNWYFYNPQLKASGANEFNRVWGKRILEDNWRRKNKASSTTSSLLDKEEEEESDNMDSESKEALKDENGNPIPETYMPDYYLSQIPKTPEDINASNDLIETSLYQMAVIYDEKLKEYNLSIDTYKEFERRFPMSDKLLDSYYSCFRMCGIIEDSVLKEVYRQKILEMYPSSRYAQILSQDNYEEKTKEMLRVQDSIYKETYEAYGKGDYGTVIENYNTINTKYPMSNLLPKFAFLKALTTGKTGNKETFGADLQNIVTTWPNADVTSTCKDILALIKQGLEAQQGSSTSTIIDKRNEMSQQEIEEISSVAKEFDDDKQTTHIMLLISKSDDENAINHLLYDIAAFNFTKFMIKSFDIDKQTVEKKNALIISTFESYDEAVWYENMMLAEPALQGKITLDKVNRLIISESNFKLITAGKTINDYKKFLQNK